MSNSAENGNMDGLNDISENNKTKRHEASPVEESICWYDFFRDVGTQVEENDILRESDLLEERITPDNSPARVGMCATGVAETAAVGNCGQIFGTAKLNTEPRLTFMLPSIRSAFDGNVTQSSPRSAAVNGQNETSSSGVSAGEPSYNLHSVPSTLSSSTSSLPPVTSLSVTFPHVTSQPMTTLPTLLSSTVTSVTMTSAKVTAVTMTFPQVTFATMTTSKSAPMTLFSMTSPPVMSATMTTSKSGEMTSLSMTSPPVTSETMTTSKSGEMTSLSMMSPPVTSATMTTSKSGEMTSLFMTSPPVMSATMTTSKSGEMTSLSMTSPPVMSATMTTSKSGEMRSLSMTSPPVTSDTTKLLRKTSTSSTSASVTMRLPQVTSSPMTSNALTSASFLPLLTTNVLDSSKKRKRLSPKLSDGREVNRKSRSPSPRLSPKRCNEQKVISRSPSPRRRDLKTRGNIDTVSPTPLHDQSREQTRDITSVKEKQTLTGVRESMGRRSTKKVIVKETTQEQSISAKSTQEQNTSGKNTPEESAMEQDSSLEKNTSEQSTREQMTSKQSIPEKRPPGNHPVLLTGPLVYTSEYVPLLTTFESSTPQTNTLETTKPALEARKSSSSSVEKGKTGYTGLETGKTGSTSPEMIASTNSAGPSGNEKSHHSVSGKKRRRTGARSFGKGKKKKSRTVVDKTGDDRELRDRLPQRVWDGTSYKVEEVGGIDFNPELSRRVSHAGSLGRVSSNPNTRLRSRNGSKSSTSDAISTTDVVPSDDVTSTSDVINNEVISNSDVISANDVISGHPRETEASEMAML